MRQEIEREGTRYREGKLQGMEKKINQERKESYVNRRNRKKDKAKKK